MHDQHPPTVPGFDLASEPWLPCLMTDGTTASFSVRSILQQAHLIRDLVLDTPTQYPPVLRMLLAVLHRALRDPRSEDGLNAPWDDDEWEHLFAKGRFPPEWIDAYLDGPAAGKLDLFSPVAPFMQAPGLHTANSETKTAALLIPHLATGHNVPLFSASRDSEPPTLTPAEAARWLLHAHAWDTAAIKTGAEGDPSAKMGKTTGNPTGPLGQLGVLFPYGTTLWHTLMFSLLSLGDHNLSPADDVPVWERDSLTAEWAERPATGLLDLYTWPSRRIRLVPGQRDSETVVSRVLVCAGDRLAPVTRDRLEPHSAFGRSEQQEKKQKRVPVYLPWTHRADRRLWRGLGAILARERTTASAGQGSGAPRYRRAHVLQQLGNEVRGEILRDEVVRLRAFGVAYGNKAAVIDNVYTDEMPLPVALLRDHDGPLERTALDAVAAADRTAGYLGGLASDISRAAGCSDENLLRAEAGRARTRLYAQLDLEFPGWITQLPPLPPEEALARWCSAVRRHAEDIARDITAAAPPGATIGRWVRQPGPDGIQRAWLTAAVAELRYRAGLSKVLALGEAAATSQEGQES